VFLQTGIRVSELAHLTLADVDLLKPAITMRGKGSVEREIALEKRGVQAVKNYRNYLGPMIVAKSGLFGL
jgi:site-specific recombinase XerD